MDIGDWLPKYRLDEVERALGTAMSIRAMTADDKRALFGMFLRCLNEDWVTSWLMWGPPDLRSLPESERYESNAPYAVK